MSLHPRCLLERRLRRRTIDRSVPMMGNGANYALENLICQPLTTASRQRSKQLSTP